MGPEIDEASDAEPTPAAKSKVPAPRGPRARLIPHIVGKGSLAQARAASAKQIQTRKKKQPRR